MYERIFKLIENYPHNALIWRNNLYNKEELVDLVQRLSQIDKPVEEEILYQSILKALCFAAKKEDLLNPPKTVHRDWDDLQ